MQKNQLKQKQATKRKSCNGKVHTNNTEYIKKRKNEYAREGRQFFKKCV